MRKFFTGLLMVVIATVSFVVGRSTSGHVQIVSRTSDNAVSTDVLQPQSVSLNPAETYINAREPAVAAIDHSSSFHAYLVFTQDQ